MIDQKHYLIRRKFLSFAGAKFHVYDADQNLVAFSRQKAFKIKEDIRVFTDESMAKEILAIRARKAIDFAAAYDVVDALEGKKVGALRRRGLTSILRDSWEILDADDQLIAKVTEDSMILAMVRRFLSNLIPQTFHAKAGDQVLITYRQRFNPFIHKLEVHIEDGAEERIDPRLALAGGILLVAIEGRQR